MSTQQANETSSQRAAAVRVPLLVVLAVGYGIALAWGGTRLAAMAARQRIPELNQIAAQSTF